jgi:hypothetical protein
MFNQHRVSTAVGGRHDLANESHDGASPVLLNYLFHDQGVLIDNDADLYHNSFISNSSASKSKLVSNDRGQALVTVNNRHHNLLGIYRSDLVFLDHTDQIDQTLEAESVQNNIFEVEVVFNCVSTDVLIDPKEKPLIWCQLTTCKQCWDRSAMTTQCE